jgi:hypothetical protein
MIERNAEKQVFASQYFDRRGFVDRRVMRRRGNPTQSGLRISGILLRSHAQSPYLRRPPSGALART